MTYIITGLFQIYKYDRTLKLTTSAAGMRLLGLSVDATCVVFMTTSAAACSVFFHIFHFFFCLSSSFVNFFINNSTCCVCYSANCAVFWAASTAGAGIAGNGNTATCKQANDANSGKNFFKFFCIHGYSPLFGYVFSPLKKTKKVNYTYYMFLTLINCITLCGGVSKETCITISLHIKFFRRE